MSRWVWHEPKEIPGAPVVIKTNLMNYFIGAYYDGKYWLKKDRRYEESSRMMGSGEYITGWAYIGGEMI